MEQTLFSGDDPNSKGSLRIPVFSESVQPKAQPKAKPTPTPPPLGESGASASVVPVTTEQEQEESQTSPERTPSFDLIAGASAEALTPPQPLPKKDSEIEIGEPGAAKDSAETKESYHANHARVDPCAQPPAVKDKPAVGEEVRPKPQLPQRPRQYELALRDTTPSSGKGFPDRSMSPPPMTPRLANAFELQRSIEMANADPQINDFGSLGCSRATYNKTRASFINDSLVSMKNPYDVDHEIVNVKSNLTKGYSPEHPHEDVSLFEQDLMENETIVAEIRVITGAQPFSYCRGFYEKFFNLITCGLRQLLSIKFEHCLWMKSGDSHQQRLALTSKDRVLMWTSHINGTATCACCWSVPVLDHFLVSNTTLQTFDLDDISFVQQKAINNTSCWPYQTVRLRIGFKTYSDHNHQLDPFGYVKSSLVQPSSTSNISEKFEWIKLFWKISTFIIWVKIFKAIVIGFAVFVGLFFPSIREAIYACFAKKDAGETFEVMEFYAEYGETHRRLSSSQKIYQQNLKDITSFHRKLTERMNLRTALKIPKIPITRNAPGESLVEVQQTPVALGLREQEIDRINVETGWNFENVLIPIRDSLWFSLAFLLIAVYGWEEQIFYELYYLGLLSSWVLLQLYHYFQYVKPRQDNKTTLLITTERLIQVSSSDSETLIIWWPLGKIEYGVVKGSKFNIWGHIKTQFGYLRISPGVTGNSLLAFCSGLCSRIPRDKASRSKRFLYNLALQTDLKLRLDLPYSGVAREELKKSWIVSNWTPVEGEKIVYTYKASNDPVSCSHSLQRSQLLVSNYRLWCGIVYKTGPFVLFWTELDQIDGFKLNGVHVSQRSYTCETLCACCFRKGISAAEVSIAGFGTFPISILTKKNESARSGYLEDSRLPGLRRIITALTLSNKQNRSRKRAVGEEAIREVKEPRQDTPNDQVVASIDFLQREVKKDETNAIENV